MSCKLYPCKLCGRVLKQLTHWKDHQATHSDVRNYSCSICTSTFKTRGAMRFHYRKRHTLQQFYANISSMKNEPSIRQRKLAKQITSVQSLRIASSIKPSASPKIKKKPQTTSMNSNNRPIKCKICDFTIKQGRNFKKHMMRHEQSNVSCPHKSCGMKFVWNKALQLHLRERHGEILIKDEFRVTTRSKIPKEEEETDDDDDDFDESLLEEIPKNSNLKISSCYSLTDESSTSVSRDESKIEEKKSYRYECVECDIGFDDNDALWKHLFEKHLNQENSTETKKGQHTATATSTSRSRRTR